MSEDKKPPKFTYGDFFINGDMEDAIFEYMKTIDEDGKVVIQLKSLEGDKVNVPVEVFHKKFRSVNDIKKR